MRTASWLDESTRKHALEKLAAMSDQVAYPEWILNDVELDEMEALAVPAAKQFEMRKGKYFETMLQLDQLRKISRFSKLRQLRNPETKG